MDKFASLVQAFCKKTGWKPFGVTVHSVHITNEIVVFVHTEGATYGYNIWRLLFDPQIGFAKAIGVQERLIKMLLQGADLDTILTEIVNATTHITDV
jgi:hypothetical protein